MPRRERALDGSDEELNGFAADLRKLRQDAGGSPYRKLSAVAHYSAATLSEAAAGRKLPSLPVTLAYVRACGGEAEEWTARWRALAARLTDGPAERVDGEHDRAPYVGLGAFRVEDASRFFGRDRVIDEIGHKLEHNRFVGVFGSSGSGKSSILRAGLVARTRAAGTPVILFNPGPQPLQECAVQLAALLHDSSIAVLAELTADPAALSLRTRQAMVHCSAGTDLLVVVDQFEEVFTLCADEDERTHFVEALVQAVRDPGGRARVVLGVLADFLGHCGRYPGLVEALSDAQLLLGPPAPEELHQAIVEPAAMAGCVVEKALVARLLSDVASQEAALPLLSHALLQTWRRRQGTTLTLAGYEAIGGIAHAIAHTAEEMYLLLDPQQATATRHLLLRLVAPGDGTADTKRRIGRSELGACTEDLVAVLENLTAARLVTQSGDHIELSHEALIRHWPRLVRWLDEDRAGLRLHRQLTESALTWKASKQDESMLYRGARLRAAQEWRDRQHGALTPVERAFLAESWFTHEGERAEAQRRSRRLRLVSAGLAVLLVLSATAMVYAMREQRTADQQRATALAQNLVTQVASLRDVDPNLAMQLSLTAYRMAPNAATRGNLLSSFGTPPSISIPGQHNGVAAAADSPLIATADADGSVRLWDITDPARPTQLTRLTDLAHGPIAMDPTGRTLAVADGANGIMLWAPGDHAQTRLPPSGAWPVSLAFNHDGSALAVIDEHQRLRLWNLQTLRATTVPGATSTVAFNSKGLVVTGSGRRVTVWSTTPQLRARSTVVIDSPVTAVAISPNAHVLAAASNATRDRAPVGHQGRHPSRCPSAPARHQRNQWPGLRTGQPDHRDRRRRHHNPALGPLRSSTSSGRIRVDQPR